MVYAIVADILWSVCAGYLHEPFWLVVAGALIAMAVGFWLQREALMRSAPSDPMQRYLLVAAAYGFLAMVASAASGLIYAAAAWLHR